MADWKDSADDEEEADVVVPLGFVEDTCEVCGKHVGWGLIEFHLKRCDTHAQA